MAYQRAIKPGRHYIWMGSDGLHLMPHHDTNLCGIDVKFLDNAAGVDNAKAMIRGLTDLLAGAGVAVMVKKGAVKFVKADR